MEKRPIIISERKRPFWQLIVAAVCFTVAIALILGTLIPFFIDTNIFDNYPKGFFIPFYLTMYATYLSANRCIYIDIEKSKFRKTKEVGPIKIGGWTTIKNYEYVSLFTERLRDGRVSFSVNLWYNNNHHFTLYDEYDFESALEIAYNLSEELNIDLLDATIANDYKWIDKEALKSTEGVS